MKTIVAMIGCLVLLLGNLEARAAYRAPVAVDTSFGINGLAVVPGYDATYFVDEVLGFAKTANGYFVFSIQHNGAGIRRLAGTAFDSSGRLVLSVGSLGTSIYAAPVPFDNQARITANGDTVYFAAVQFNSVSGDFQYYVLTIDATTEALTSYVSRGPRNMPSGGTEQARAIDAILTYGSGVMVASRGTTASSGAGNVIDLLAINGNPATIDAGHSYYFWPSASFRVNQISDYVGGLIEMAGINNGTAAYAGFDLTTHTTTVFKSIPFRCLASSVNSSAADRVIRANDFYPDALVYGRMTCPGGTDTYATLTRISSIESSSSVVWSTIIGRDAANCDPSGPACASAYAALFFVPTAEEHVDRLAALATSPSQELVYFDFGGGTDRAPPVSGTEINQGDITVTPSLNKGTDLAYPNLIAPARRSSTGQLGLARIVIDRVFANGIDTIP